MLPPETIAEIDRLVYDTSDSSAQLSGIAALESAEALQRLAFIHNWDDGFGVPTAIANHSKCDLGTALNLFWLAEALCWFSGEIKPDEHNRDWVAFCELITNRIVGGLYRQGATSCKVPLGIVKRHLLKKQGVPEILITDVQGEVPAPFSVT